VSQKWLERPARSIGSSNRQQMQEYVGIADRMPNTSPAPTLRQASLPIAFLILLIIYGLIVRPLALGLSPLPLEVVFLLASAFAISQLIWLGHSWQAIQDSIVARMSRGIPGFFVLFAIGMLVGSWIACGTIPMLVCWGVRVLDPQWFYALAFFVPVVFSSLTGTSWGSAGTVGVVIIGIAGSIEADLAITAGAVIGGAYFGDKMSPLSDTTNMAALGAGVDLFEHIRSMMWTTLPAALLALSTYTVIGFVETPTGNATSAESTAFVTSLESMFVFHWALLLPPLLVLIGSMRRMPTIPVLGAAIILACTIAILIQPFSITSVCTSLTNGFEVSMTGISGEVPTAATNLLERGGLASMKDAIFIAFLVFFFIGIIDRIDAMPLVVNRVFSFAKSQPAAVLSALGSSGLTNALTTNQYATSFIVGDAFQKRFDALNIPRKVLSRSIEDTGTMIETLVPWHPSALFMVATLGVPVSAYWHWQLLTLSNVVIAPVLAITGIGCWYGSNKSPQT
jgi:Na+:H+ antiporter, NhaC family